MFIDIKSPKIREKIIEYLEKKGIPFTEKNIKNIFELNFDQLSKSEIDELTTIIQEADKEEQKEQSLYDEKYNQPIFIDDKTEISDVEEYKEEENY